MRSNGPLANKEVAIGGHGLPKKLEPCGWMPFTGLPDGPFRWGIARIADSDSVNHGSNPGPSGDQNGRTPFQPRQGSLQASCTGDHRHARHEVIGFIRICALDLRAERLPIKWTHLIGRASRLRLDSGRTGVSPAQSVFHQPRGSRRSPYRGMEFPDPGHDLIADECLVSGRSFATRSQRLSLCPSFDASLRIRSQKVRERCCRPRRPGVPAGLVICPQRRAPNDLRRSSRAC
jgi:hypothetical protein